MKMSSREYEPVSISTASGYSAVYWEPDDPEYEYTHPVVGFGIAEMVYGGPGGKSVVSYVLDVRTRKIVIAETHANFIGVIKDEVRHRTNWRLKKDPNFHGVLRGGD